MQDKLIIFLFSLLTLIIGAGLEESLPEAFAVGFPVLLAAAQFMAMRSSRHVSLLFALAAGAVEDAISSLPPMTSASFFFGASFLTHWSELPRSVVALTYPLYQLWLLVWVSSLRGNVFSRVLISIPIGFVTAFAVWAMLAWVERKASLNEAG